jgi:O-antigen/teichoic acid export membrane protein
MDRKPRPSPLAALTWLSALTLAQSGMGLLLLPLYVGALQPAELGVLAAVNVVGSIFGAAATLKLDGAMRAFYFDHERDSAGAQAYLQLTFTAALVAGMIACGAMLVVGDTLFEVLFAHAEARFYPAGALAIATAAGNSCLAVYFAYLRNRMEFLELARWQALIVVGTLATQVVLVLALGLGLAGALWGALLPVATTLLLVCIARPNLLGWRLDWRQLLPSLRYSLPLVALAVCFVLATRLDRLVLERHVTLDTLGAYSLLLSLLGLQAMVLGAVDGAIRPQLFGELRENRTRAQRAVESHQELYCLSGLIALSVAVFIGANLHLITDDAGYLAMQAWLPHGASAFAAVILGKYYALLHEGQKRSVSLTMAVALRLTTFLVLLAGLVPRFGVGGALTAIIATEALTTAVLGHSAAKALGCKLPVRTVVTMMGVFIVGLWSSRYVAGGSMPLFGALQLVVIVGLLLATNRRALRALRARVHAAPPAESGL